MTVGPQPLGTLACGGAPGVQKPGLDKIVTIAGFAADAAITLATDGLASIFLSAIVSGIQYDLGEICPNGDPGEVTLTQQDYDDASNPVLLPQFLAATQKIHQWFVHLMWPYWCDCADGSAPPPNVVANPPAVGINTGAPGGPSGGTCWSADVTGAYNAIGQLVFPYNVLLWNDGGSTVATRANRAIIPNTNLVKVRVQYHRPAGDTTTHGAFALISYFNATGGQIGTISGPTPPNYTDDFTLQLAPPSGTATVTVNVGTESDVQVPANATVEGTISVFCGTGGPGTPSSPCCPPDPSTDIRLRSIQDMLVYLMNHTGGVPTGYTKGTVHTGISGAGTIPINGLSGVLVDITSGVPTNPVLPGTPPYEWSVGWMSVSSGDGMIDEKRITRQHQVWLSGLAPFATIFGYYLNPGFTINVTELLPA